MKREPEMSALHFLGKVGISDIRLFFDLWNTIKLILDRAKWLFHHKTI